MKKSNTFVLQPYKPEFKACLIDLFRFNTPLFFHPDELKDFEEYLKDQGEHYFVIEQNNRTIGGVGVEFRMEDQSGRINWIFIDPLETGKGIGKQVVQECLIQLSKIPEVEQFVVRTSQLVYPFFESCGFEIKYTEKDYWAKGLDLYYMEKSR